MIGLVLFRARHLLSRSVFGSSLAGDGLLVRLRSTSIGLIGIVTAVGLGLIAFSAQLGWPGVFNAPIPAGPHGAAAVHSAVALTRSAPGGGPVRLALASKPAAPAPARHVSGSSTDGPSVDSGLGGSNQLGTSGSSTRTTPPVVQSPPASTVEPGGQPIAVVPVAASTPSPSVPSEPSTSVSGGEPKDQTSESKSHGTATVKPDTSEGEAGSAQTDKDGEKGEQGEETKTGETKTRSHHGQPKSPNYPPQKPDEDDYVEAPPPEASVPPVVAPPSKGAGQGPRTGEDKDAAHAGESGWQHH